jgi:adenine-specific DNA-methyltransferase
LEHAYTDKVDMIYIDPPYNTGTDGFVYNDKFSFSDEKLENILGLTSDEVRKIRNLEGKCSHAAWLTFMYPRLKIAKRLLKDTGVIFISIDDNEQANLRLLCDEIFGEGNFIGTMIRKTASNRAMAKTFSVLHEYTLVYSKAIGDINMVGNSKNKEAYQNPDNDPRGAWKQGNPSMSGSNRQFKIINPFTGKIDLPPKGRGWAFSENKLEQMIKTGQFLFKKEHRENERGFVFKQYLEGKGDYDLVNSMMLGSNEYLNQVATKQNFELFDENYFDYAKPVNFVNRLIYFATTTKHDALILDFFAGSGTTAQAVMELNKEDGGNRKWILCNLDEATKEESTARKAGYKTIDEISRERIKRAAKKLGDESGFKSFYLKTPDIKTLDEVEEFDIREEKLVPDDMIKPFEFTSDSGIETLLTTWLLDDGYEFGQKVEELKLNNYIAYYAPELQRLYLIDNENWTNESCKELLDKLGRNDISVNTIVVYAYSFGFTRINELRNNLKSENRANLITRY